MSKKVLIIGNGFDLDLGLKTRYSDFAKSEYWPNKDNILLEENLQKAMNGAADMDAWFDLEQVLADYAASQHGDTFVRPSHYFAEDKPFFERLTNGLTQYLENEQRKRDINKDSVAAKVLKAIVENGYFSSIYSFNYTDLSCLAAKTGVEVIKYEHVHGCLKDNSIILGVDDKIDLCKGYSFLYKTFNKYYTSHHIQYDLQEADEVVFFGHSLGPNDYHYFQQFFKYQCRDGMDSKDMKRITFFTYDDQSRISLLEKLREMNDKRTDLLFMLNDMSFICTKDGDAEKVQNFLTHMKESSVSADVARANSLDLFQ